MGTTWGPARSPDKQFCEKENEIDKNLPHPRPPDYKHGWPREKGAGSDDLLDAAEVGGHEEGGDGGEEASQGEPELGRERLKKRQPVPVLPGELDEEPVVGSFSELEAISRF